MRWTCSRSGGSRQRRLTRGTFAELLEGRCIKGSDDWQEAGGNKAVMLARGWLVATRLAASAVHCAMARAVQKEMTDEVLTICHTARSQRLHKLRHR